MTSQITVTLSMKPASIMHITHYEHSYNVLRVVMVMVTPTSLIAIIFQHYRRIIMHYKCVHNGKSTSKRSWYEALNGI